MQKPLNQLLMTQPRLDYTGTYADELSRFTFEQEVLKPGQPVDELKA